MHAPVVEFVDPTLAVHVVDVPPEGVGRAQPAPVAADVAPALEIQYAAPTTVAEFIDPTPAASCVAPAPMVESVDPHGKPAPVATKKRRRGKVAPTADDTHATSASPAAAPAASDEEATMQHVSGLLARGLGEGNPEFDAAAARCIEVGSAVLANLNADALLLEEEQEERQMAKKKAKRKKR